MCFNKYKDQLIYNVGFKSKDSQLSKWMKTSKHFATEMTSNSLNLKWSFVWASGVIQVTLLQQQVMLLKWLYSFCFALGKIDIPST